MGQCSNTVACGLLPIIYFGKAIETRCEHRNEWVYGFEMMDDDVDTRSGGAVARCKYTMREKPPAGDAWYIQASTSPVDVVVCETTSRSGNTCTTIAVVPGMGSPCCTTSRRPPGHFTTARPSKGARAITASLESRCSDSKRFAKPCDRPANPVSRPRINTMWPNVCMDFNAALPSRLHGDEL